MRRRTVLGTVAGLSLGGLAGCSGDDGDTPTPRENEVLVGPNDSLSFTPETVTVSPGTTVTWRFESNGHNVSCDPDHHASASLPDGADPFASYDGDDTYGTSPTGKTFTHTFDVPGNYDYVCIPHATTMRGTVVVEE